MNRSALGEFASNLQREIGAERVLLFGSRARDQAHADSDYDLIIVSRRFADQSRRERPVALYRRWYEAGGDGPVDFICLTPEEFDDARTRISLIAAVLPEAVDLLAATATPG
jgi:predicted nucleotidyltransferase